MIMNKRCMKSKKFHFFRDDVRQSRPLILLGPIFILCGLCLIIVTIEIFYKLKKEVKRVMDRNLLRTNNFHEVKHWVEPGNDIEI